MKRTKVFTILVLTLLLVLSGCSKKEVIDFKGKDGYDLSLFMDKNKDIVDNSLAKESLSYSDEEQIDYFGYQYFDRILSSGIKKQDLDFTDVLSFFDTTGKGQFVCTGYAEKITLDEWPDEETAGKLQAYFNTLMDTYGTPDDIHYIEDLTNLFDEYKISKYVNWGKYKSFSIDYDMETHKVKICFSNVDCQFINEHSELLD